jgi:hypothetical protein
MEEATEEAVTQVTCLSDGEQPDPRGLIALALWSPASGLSPAALESDFDPLSCCSASLDTTGAPGRSIPSRTACSLAWSGQAVSRWTHVFTAIRMIRRTVFRSKPVARPMDRIPSPADYRRIT